MNTPTIAFRFIISLTALAAAFALLRLAGDPERLSRDPALRLLKIVVLPELAYAAFEALYLLFALANVSPPFPLAPLAECAQAALGLAYVRFTYRSWEVNGLSTSGYVPFPWFAAATVASMLIALARIPFPALLPRILILNKAINGSMALYAAACAVIARGKKKDFLPSTRGGFWVALFGLAYAPFVGLIDMSALPVGPFSPERPASLQLFPVRELATLFLFAIHTEPLYSRLFRDRAGCAAALSDRERQVADCIVRGMSNGEISETLNMSIPTAKTHARNIYRKTGVSSRGELALSAGIRRP